MTTSTSQTLVSKLLVGVALGAQLAFCAPAGADVIYFDDVETGCSFAITVDHASANLPPVTQPHCSDHIVVDFRNSDGNANACRTLWVKSQAAGVVAGRAIGMIPVVGFFASFAASNIASKKVQAAQEKTDPCLATQVAPMHDSSANGATAVVNPPVTP